MAERHVRRGPQQPVAPNLEQYHRSIAAELTAVRDRVRTLVQHWPTDGGHKEVALRSVLKRHVPGVFQVGHGFIVTPAEASPQIDLLVIDTRVPTLFRDGDLFIVTPNAVRAAVEVKSQLQGQRRIADAVSGLARASRMSAYPSSIWTGLFVFEGECLDNDHRRMLKGLAAGDQDERCRVNAVSLGENLFVRWWPEGEAALPAQAGLWRSYGLAGLAPAYFLGNLLNHLLGPEFAAHSDVWFPLRRPGGKESFSRFEIRPGEREVRVASPAA